MARLRSPSPGPFRPPKQHRHRPPARLRFFGITSSCHRRPQRASVPAPPFFKYGSSVFGSAGVHPLSPLTHITYPAPAASPLLWARCDPAGKPLSRTDSAVGGTARSSVSARQSRGASYPPSPPRSFTRSTSNCMGSPPRIKSKHRARDNSKHNPDTLGTDRAR